MEISNLIEITEYDNNYDAYIEAIYSHFHNDFVKNPVKIFNGKRIVFKKEPYEKNKEAIFWHLVSEGPIESERNICLRRCERICWIKQLVCNCHTEHVNMWETKRGSDKRMIISKKDFSYVVILSDQKNVMVLITAYDVQHNSQKEKLRKEYEKYESAKNKNRQGSLF